MSTSPKAGGCKTCELSLQGDVCGSFVFYPNIDAEGNDQGGIGDIELQDNNINDFVNNMKGSDGGGFKNNEQSQDAKEETKTEIENQLREALTEALENRGIEPKPNTKYRVCAVMDVTTTIHSGSNCGHGADVNASYDSPELN